MNVVCKSHPKYEAKRKPRVNCGTVRRSHMRSQGGTLESEARVHPYPFSHLIVPKKERAS